MKGIRRQRCFRKGGTSLCYQIPALLLPGIRVVVSPLVALMKDQTDRLSSLGIEAVRPGSTLGAEENVSVMSRFRDFFCAFRKLMPKPD